MFCPSFFFTFVTKYPKFNVFLSDTHILFATNFKFGICSMIFDKFSLYVCDILSLDYYVGRFYLPGVVEIIKIIHKFKHIPYI